MDGKNVPLEKTVPYCPPALLPKVVLHHLVGDTSGTNIPFIIPNSVDSTELLQFSNFLFQMKEPLLYNVKFKKDVYRFTWLRSIHESIVIRIEKDSNSINLFWSKSSGNGIYNPVRVYDQGTVHVPLKNWEKFIQILNACKFWNLQKGVNDLEDSSSWILEGVTQNQYHITIRYTPGSEENFYKTCMFLLNLANIHIPKYEIYD
ncbi:MAG: hypothetical protein NTU98_09270 [Bacteroidetes bacterium]|nr:hypothetical protein [Bacteroidota bacterium]